MGDHRNDRFADGWYVGLQSGTSKPVRGGFENIELTCRQNTGVTSVWQRNFNGGEWFPANQGETVDSLLERTREQIAIERRRPAGPPAGKPPVATADDSDAPRSSVALSPLSGPNCARIARAKELLKDQMVDAAKAAFVSFGQDYFQRHPTLRSTWKSSHRPIVKLPFIEAINGNKKLRRLANYIKDNKRFLEDNWEEITGLSRRRRLARCETFGSEGGF